MTNSLVRGSGSNTYFWAVLALLGSATMWGTIWYPLRLLGERGLLGLWCLLIMYGSALILSAPWWWRHRRELLCQPRMLALLGLLSGWSNVAFILAVIDGEVVRVTLLFFLYPIWAILIGRIFLHERMSTLAWIGFVTAVTGALVMMWNPELGNPLPRITSDWLALSAGFTFALSAAIVRGLHKVSVVPKTIVVWAGVVLVAIVWLVVQSVPLPAVSSETYFAAVLLGIFATVMMTLLVQYGFHHVPVYRSSVILLFELVAGAASAYWLANEVPASNEWMGGVIIVMGAWLMFGSTSNDSDGRV